MFGKSSISDVAGALTRGSRLQGRYLFVGGLRIEGQFVGELLGEGEGSTLVVGEHGSVEGPIRADHVVIHGKVLGSVLASQQLTLHAGAQVEGELHYRLLEMHPGALVTGQLLPILGHAEAPAAAASTPAPATSAPEPRHESAADKPD